MDTHPLRALLAVVLMLPCCALAQSYPYFPPPGYTCTAGPPAQIPFAAASNALSCSSLLSWTNSNGTLTLGSTTTPATIQPATPGATSNGASLTVSAGVGGSTSGNGAPLNLNGGNGANTATVTSGNGGNVAISAGRGALNSNNGTPTGNGGNVTIAAGIGAGTVLGASATGDGGTITITGGAPDSGNGGSGNGGNIAITAGSSFGGSGAKTAGNLTLKAGAPGLSGDTAGNASIFGGVATTCGSAEIGVGNVFASLKFTGTSGGACTSAWALGPISASGNRLTGTDNGGVQLGAPTGADCGAGCFNVSSDLRVNNASVKQLTGTSGSIGGGALVAGQCASGTVSVTNSTTSMAVIASPTTYPGDGAEWSSFVSAAGTVTVKVCAIVALTPTASTYNVRVIQ